MTFTLDILGKNIRAWISVYGFIKKVFLASSYLAAQGRGVEERWEC